MFDDGAVPCPRCGFPMRYLIETESLGRDGKRIKYYYKCPRCGYKMHDVEILVKGDGAGAMLKARITRMIEHHVKG